MPIFQSLTEEEDDNSPPPENSNNSNRRMNNNKHNKNKNSKFPIALQIHYRKDKIGQKVKVFGKKFYERYKNEPNAIEIQNPNRGLLEYIKLGKDQDKNECNVLCININKTLEDLSYMFADCEEIEQIIGLEKLVNKKVTNLSNMFLNCKSLKKIKNLNEFDTQNVISMNSMFRGCISLESLLEIYNFNTIYLNLILVQLKI